MAKVVEYKRVKFEGATSPLCINYNVERSERQS